jgi:hypothetical protein
LELEMPIEPRGTVGRHYGWKPGIVDFVEIDELQIAAWSSGKPEEKIPPTQVHLIHKIKGLDVKILLRFKGPDTLGFLIEELTKYRREVWPDSEKVKGE